MVEDVLYNRKTIDQLKAEGYIFDEKEYKRLDPALVRNYNQKIVDLAIAYNQISILKDCKKILKSDFNKCYTYLNKYKLACLFKAKDAFNFLIEEGRKKLSREDIIKVYNLAAGLGSLEIFKSCLQNCPTSLEEGEKFRIVYYSSIENEDSSIFFYIFNDLKWDISEKLPFLLKQSVLNQKFEIADFLIYKKGVSIENAFFDTNSFPLDNKAVIYYLITEAFWHKNFEYTLLKYKLDIEDLDYLKDNKKLRSFLLNVKNYTTNDLIKKKIEKIFNKEAKANVDFFKKNL